MMRGMNRSSAMLLTTAVEAGITSPSELANLMAQGSVESDGYTSMYEGVIYRDADRLIRKVHSAIERFTRSEIEAAVESRDPVSLATILYEKRSDLGNTEAGDGFKFRGRGVFQITGRRNYTAYGNEIGINLVDDPDLAADPEAAAKIAVAFWKRVVPVASRRDPLEAGKKINGGDNSADERVAEAHRWSAFITEDLVRDIQRGILNVDALTAMGDVRGDAEREAERVATIALQRGLNQLGYRDAHDRSLVEDGAYGRGTRAAVTAFQRDHGLHPDGIAGPRTLAAIDEAGRSQVSVADRGVFGPVPPQAASDPLAPYEALRPVPVPRLGTPVPSTDLPSPLAVQPEAQAARHGADPGVLRTQQQLNRLGIRDMQNDPLVEDGIYGSLTRTAVARFQAQEHLPITGKIDDATRAAVESSAFLADLQQSQENLRLSEASVPLANDAPTIQWRDPQGPTIQWRQAPMDPLESEREAAQGHRAGMTHPEAEISLPLSRAPQRMPSLSDPRNPMSADHALYSELGRLVPDASEERLLQFTAACHSHRITEENLHACHIDEKTMSIGFFGSDPFSTPAIVDLNSHPPTAEETVAQIEQHDHRQSQLLEQVQVQQMSRSGPSL